MAPLPDTKPISIQSEKPVAALTLPDVSALLKIQLTADEIQAIITVVGIFLRSAGLGALTDFVGTLIKSWVHANAPTKT